MQDTPPALQALSALLDLARRARRALSDRELGFLLVNDTHALAPYRQAALWLSDEGVYTVSGVVQMEANAPYVQWVSALCAHWSAQAAGQTRMFTAHDLPEPLAGEWEQWWPAHALWVSWGEAGGCVLVRDEPWTEAESALLGEWVDTWQLAFTARHALRVKRWQAWRSRWQAWWALGQGQPWWRQRRFQVLAACLAVLLFPVRLTVLAPGELVPAHPAVVRAPLEGVVDVFHVQPNQVVKKDQPLFGFDEALIQSRVEVAQQALATAETDYRQTSQLALTDAKSKGQLALLMGKIEEKRAEVAYLAEQLQRARVLAPQDGVVLMDDPSDWIGRPVVVGERILRVAREDDVEVEAWLPLADAIALPPEASVQLYLNASPLSPVQARVRYLSHDAVQRPEGHQAYRLRAVLAEPTAHRVGLKGTAKVQGHWVPLAYWMLRRPWATLRGYLGF